MKRTSLAKAKRVVALSFILIFFLKSSIFCQNVQHLRAFSASFGRSGTPGAVLQISHERYCVDKVNLSYAGFFETANRNDIKYRAVGLVVMARYYSNLGIITRNRFQLSGGLGLTGDYETEDHLYKDLAGWKKLNGGIAGQIDAEWAFTKDFSLLLTGTQKCLLSHELGTHQYYVLLGCKIKFF